MGLLEQICGVESSDEKIIPTTFNIFKLKKSPKKAHFLKIANIMALQSVTFIPRPQDRLKTSNSGWYVNVYPWINWRKGQPFPLKKIFDGKKGRKRKPKELKLREEQQPAGNTAVVSFSSLNQQFVQRRNLLQKLGINLKNSLHPSLFED